jgi:histidine triad (HIT) family protein
VTCVFCERILVDAYDAGNEHAVTFEPLAPVTRGHRLFVPRIHVAGALAYPHLTGLVMDYAASWAARYGKYPCNFITSCGAEATQSIFHLHIHLVPRRADDGLTLPWTGQDTA